MLSFTKMNGAGNDFVMIDNRDAKWSLSGEQIAHLCDRHRGVGGDGLIAVEPPESDADFRMRYYNADGGEAEMCGNGARCFARFAAKLAGRNDAVRFETIAGVVTAELLGENVRLQMSAPRDLVLGTSLLAAGENVIIHSVNTGVPHAVVFVEDLARVNLCALGPAIRYHEHFQPKGTNANFVEVKGPSELAIRTYERGVENETLACGTGVCAAALIHHALTGAASPVTVTVRGGDPLEVGFVRDGETFSKVTLTGPADFVFDGTVSI